MDRKPPRHLEPRSGGSHCASPSPSFGLGSPVPAILRQTAVLHSLLSQCRLQGADSRFNCLNLPSSHQNYTPERRTSPVSFYISLGSGTACCSPSGSSLRRMRSPCALKPAHPPVSPFVKSSRHVLSTLAVNTEVTIFSRVTSIKEFKRQDLFLHVYRQLLQYLLFYPFKCQPMKNSF